MKIEPVQWRPGIEGFVKDCSFGDDKPSYASWGENVIFEGENLVRAARKPLNVNLDVVNQELVYNVTLTANSEDVAGSGSSFLTDLVPFQHFLANNQLYVVTRLVSDTAMKIDPKPTANFTGHIFLVPNLHENQ
ncbi:MAG: hypothetical protein U0Y68_20775 [Blastocatellia bacterium]